MASLGGLISTLCVCEVYCVFVCVCVPSNGYIGSSVFYCLDIIARPRAQGGCVTSSDQKHSGQLTTHLELN